MLLLPLFWRNRELIRSVRPRHLLFIAIGAGAPYAYVTGTGVALTAAGVGGAMTVGLMPAFTLLLSALVLRERISRNLVAGTVIIVLGALAWSRATRGMASASASSFSGPPCGQATRWH